MAHGGMTGVAGEAYVQYLNKRLTAKQFKNYTQLVIEGAYCTCFTKRPEPQYHSPSCKWHMASIRIHGTVLI